MAVKVLLDTDIGSDIDDAVCLAYLLTQPACELLGITTVTGEPERRAMLASALCKAAGRDVPIYPGAASPLLIAQRQPHVPQAAALARWPHDRDFPQGQSVDFLRRTIRQHPGEVVLLTIGPLTNAALLFAADAEIPSLLRGLVMMCGMFAHRLAGPPVEWNARLDPHATAMVYRAAPPLHRSIGLDVTMQVKMEMSEVRQRFQVGLLRPVLDMAEIFFRERPVITFHDPLAAATVFDDAVCGFERGRVEVEHASERLGGFLYWQPDGSGPHEAALQVDARRFFDHYFSVFA